MKNLLSILIACLIFAPLAFAQKRQSDREAGGLKGKVKTVRLERELLKRNQSEAVIKDGKTILEPYEVAYRIITYY